MKVCSGGSEKERSRIRDVQMYNLKGLLSIRRMVRFPKARMRELCGVKKDLDQGFPTGGSRSLVRSSLG